MLQQYTIADILSWLKDKTLLVNRDYQRNSGVWPVAAKAYLIDTILRELPMPKIYLRTKTSPVTMRSYREIVDGQQRVLAMQSYANNEFALGSNREVFAELAGKRYLDLDEEFQEKFLGYLVSIEQLLNASDSVVFDVFRRLNTYNYNLSPQELRHGKYQGRFRAAVVASSRQWGRLWDKYRINGNRSRVRMADDELMAQMFGVVLEGVCDGGQPKIERLYKKYDAEMSPEVVEQVSRVIQYMDDNFSEVLETDLAGAPHFLMLFAAVAHALIGIPPGDMGEAMPERDPRALSDLVAAQRNLSLLADALNKEQMETAERFHEFQYASAGTTQRIRSRRVRFEMLYRALLPDLI